jgi:hypothetical protein
MSEIAWGGLAVLTAGLFVWLISKPLVRWASSSHAYLMPSSNHETFRRRQMILVRIVATIFILFGGGFIIYGLLGGD